MAQCKAQPLKPWQLRRKAYLRTTGRLRDLIKEGYVINKVPDGWLVITGRYIRVVNAKEHA